jgi:5-hydroxyisourate hydrolase
MNRVTTHVLDVVLGKPAAGIGVRLDRREDDAWIAIADGATDEDGRCRDLASNADDGTYRLTFAIGGYFKKHERTSIYPEIQITFCCSGEEHYHLPVLLSDNSYTTYRGS